MQLAGSQRQTKFACACRSNEKADIYSYGVLLWELIKQESPVRGHMHHDPIQVRG